MREGSQSSSHAQEVGKKLGMGVVFGLVCKSVGRCLRTKPACEEADRAAVFSAPSATVEKPSEKWRF